MFHDRETILNALQTLGNHPAMADKETTIVVLAGRASAMLTQQSTQLGVTHDCDVVAWPGGFSRSGSIEACAQTIAAKLKLSRNWFNSECYQTSAWKLPPDYQDRWEHVGRFGPLDVRCISRQDFIAMKFLATRDRDMQDLMHLQPTVAEVQWFSDYLEILEKRYPAQTLTFDLAKGRLKGFQRELGVHSDDQ